MRRALACLMMAAVFPALSLCADRKSWNRVRYHGGTLTVKTTPYDWNTTLTINGGPDTITVVIAPDRIFSGQTKIEIRASQVISLASGSAAWRRVGEVAGASLPPRPRSLFGLSQEYNYLGIVYATDQGKPGALLLECFYAWQVQNALAKLTGKTVEHAP